MVRESYGPHPSFPHGLRPLGRTPTFKPWLRLQAYNIGVSSSFVIFSVISSELKGNKLLAVLTLFFVVPSHLEGHHKKVEGHILDCSVECCACTPAFKNPKYVPGNLLTKL